MGTLPSVTRICRLSLSLWSILPSYLVAMVCSSPCASLLNIVWVRHAAPIRSDASSATNQLEALERRKHRGLEALTKFDISQTVQAGRVQWRPISSWGRCGSTRVQNLTRFRTLSRFSSAVWTEISPVSLRQYIFSRHVLHETRLQPQFV